MKAAEYEKHKNEIDQQAKNIAREVRKIHAGTDEGTLRMKAEDQKRREEREECLHAADVLEKRIKCSTVECPEDNMRCAFCRYHVTFDELTEATKTAVKVLRQEGGEDG